MVEVSPGTDSNGGDEPPVRFEPYLGVGPRRFFDYFSMGLVLPAGSTAAYAQPDRGLRSPEDDKTP